MHSCASTVNMFLAAIDLVFTTDPTRLGSSGRFPAVVWVADVDLAREFQWASLFCENKLFVAATTSHCGRGNMASYIVATTSQHPRKNLDAPHPDSSRFLMAVGELWRKTEELAGKVCGELRCFPLTEPCRREPSADEGAQYPFVGVQGCKGAGGDGHPGRSGT